MEDHRIDPAAGAKRVAEKLESTARDVLEELAGGTLDESVCGVGGKTTMATEKLYPQVFGELIGRCNLTYIPPNPLGGGDPGWSVWVRDITDDHAVELAAAHAEDPLEALAMLALKIAAAGNLVSLIVGMAGEGEADDA